MPFFVIQPFIFLHDECDECRWMWWNDECRLGSEVLTTSWFWWCDTQLICRFFKLMDWQNFWYWVDAQINTRTMHYSDPGLVAWILHNWFYKFQLIFDELVYFFVFGWSPNQWKPFPNLVPINLFLNLFSCLIEFRSFSLSGLLFDKVKDNFR